MAVSDTASASSQPGATRNELSPESARDELSPEQSPRLHRQVPTGRRRCAPCAQ